MKIRFYREMHRAGWAFWVMEQRGNAYIPLKITIEKLPEESSDHAFKIPEDAIKYLNEYEARSLFTALTEALEDAGMLQATTAGKKELDATKFHLEDMRKLVFKNENNI